MCENFLDVGNYGVWETEPRIYDHEVCVLNLHKLGCHKIVAFILHARLCGLLGWELRGATENFFLS